MIDVARDQLIPITQVCKRFPRADGKKRSSKTIARWILSGVRGVKLEAVRVGGSWYTTDECIREFSNALTHSAGGSRQTVKSAADELIEQLCLAEGL